MDITICLVTKVWLSLCLVTKVRLSIYVSSQKYGYPYMSRHKSMAIPICLVTKVWLSLCLVTEVWLSLYVSSQKSQSFSGITRRYPVSGCTESEEEILVIRVEITLALQSNMIFTLLIFTTRILSQELHVKKVTYHIS